MDNSENDERTDREEFSNKGLNFFSFLIALVRYRWLIVVGSSIVSLIAIIVVSFYRPIGHYTARATILTPSQQATVPPGGLSFFLGLSGIGSGIDLKLLLDSRGVLDSLIDKLRLMEIYRASREGARDRLKRFVSIASSGGITSILVKDEDPRLATDLANAFVEELDQFRVTLLSSSATRQREFIEKKLPEAKEALMEAEEKLLNFRFEHNVIDLPSQYGSVIGRISGIKSQIRDLELNLKMLKLSAGEQNTDVIKTEARIEELMKQLAEAETGELYESPSKNEKLRDHPKFFHSFDEYPFLQRQLQDLERDVEIKASQYQLYKNELERVKIHEAKDYSTIEVFEKAIISEISSPGIVSQSKFIVISIMASLLFFIMLVLGLDYLRNLKKDEEGAKRLEELRIAFRDGRSSYKTDLSEVKEPRQGITR